MQHGKPDIAIVVTTYRREDLLRVLLRSIERSTVAPTSVVLVDNDDSPEVRALAEEHGVTRYVGMAQNTGGAGGFSRGIAEAHALGCEWIWVMDDDVEVLPDAIEKMAPWLAETDERLAAGAPLDQVVGVYQGLRRNYDDSFFYWQYHFMPRLGIPNPIAPSAFAEGETCRAMNTACFEGSMFNRRVVDAIGLPDARFFIYWDDTVYGYLASKVTQMQLVRAYVLKRTRRLDNVRIGRVRKLNSTSDLSRYHIMRNRGHMAHYLEENGEYNPIVFGAGTALTFAKEFIRLFVNKSFASGLPKLAAGMREARAIRKDASWRPYAEIMPLAGADDENAAAPTAGAANPSSEEAR